METFIFAFVIGVLILNIWHSISMTKEIKRLDIQLDYADQNVIDLEEELRLTTNRYNRKLYRCNKLEELLVNFQEGGWEEIHKFLMKEQKNFKK